LIISLFNFEVAWESENYSIKILGILQIQIYNLYSVSSNILKSFRVLMIKRRGLKKKIVHKTHMLNEMSQCWILCTISLNFFVRLYRYLHCLPGMGCILPCEMLLFIFKLHYKILLNVMVISSTTAHAHGKTYLVMMHNSMFGMSAMIVKVKPQ